MNLFKFWRRLALRVAIGATCAVSHAAPPPEQAPAAASAAPALADQAAADSELDNARGGTPVTATTSIDTRLAGQVNGNTATNVQTGWNVINGGAFANMTGIPIVVQNSGANVLIQNATVIQLQLQ